MSLFNICIIVVFLIIFFNAYLAHLDEKGPGKRRLLGFKKHRKSKANIPFDHISHEILIEHVEFYIRLADQHKIQFRKDMAWFLSCTRVVGVGIPVSLIDEHLVAASAIIPIFHFEHWENYELHEVLLFRGSFNFEFETDADDSQILGLVGTGKMEGKMALSIDALYEGFLNKEDRHNTAVHEFIHLLDKADGRVDGMPKILLSYSYALPWLKLIRYKMGQVQNGQSDIDPYAGLSLAEFFAVSCEYFFERPEEFQKNHPELYEQMDNMFRGSLKEIPPA